MGGRYWKQWSLSNQTALVAGTVLPQLSPGVMGPFTSLPAAPGVLKCSPPRPFCWKCWCAALSVQATVYVYELVEGEVKVDKLEFTKSSGGRGLLQ